MSVKLETMELLYYPSKTSGLVRLPQAVDMEQLKRDFERAEVAGVVPYYEEGNWELNATTAVMVKNALRSHRILAPIPAVNLKEARNYLQTFSAGGFDAFIMPELVGGVPVQHKAGFWQMSGVLYPHYWIHLAGGRGIDIPADVSGRWTWSKEGM